MRDLYSNAMREAHQRDMIQLMQRNARLTERIRELEQFIKDWLGHTRGEDIAYVSL